MQGGRPCRQPLTTRRMFTKRPYEAVNSSDFTSRKYRLVGFVQKQSVQSVQNI